MIKIHRIKNRVLFIVLVMIITAILTRFAFKLNEINSIYYEREFNATFRVANFGGFSADTDVINFGAATIGGSSTKEIVIYHEYFEPLKAEIIYEGDIAKTIIPVTPFILEPKTERRVNLIAYAGDVSANYTGKIKIMLVKT